MSFQRVHQSGPRNSQIQQNTSRFAPRPLTIQAQQDSQRPPTQEEIDDVRAQSLEQAARFGHHFANIPVYPLGMQASAPVQPKQMTGDHSSSSTEQRPNQTGLPDRLKAGIENLSGFSLDNAKVHYHSDKPAQLNALAYTQGTEIHVAPGQERHLPHEAWHVVQQAQGRVKPTMQMKDGVPVNDDEGLEHEADVMGAKALCNGPHAQHAAKFQTTVNSDNATTSQENESLEEGATLQSKPPAQLSRVISNHYRSLEPPITTLIEYLSYWSGQTQAQVITDLATPLSAAEIGALNHATIDRPDRVIAILDVMGAGAVNANFQHGIGRMGVLEDRLRGRAASVYNGGHLLGNQYGGFWAMTNTPRNLAPQSDTSNTAGGNWWKAEMKIANLINAGKTVLLDASVSYPDRTYTVPGWRMYNLVAPGTPTAIGLSTVGKFLFWTFHTWTPSQFNISFTAIRAGQADPTVAPNRMTLPLWWVGKLTNPVTRQLFGTFLNAVQRLQPVQSLATTAYGPFGSDVVENQDHPYHGIMNEAKQDLIDVGKIYLLMGLMAKYGIGTESVFAALAYIPGFSYFTSGLEYLGLSQAAIMASPLLTAALLWIAAKQFSFLKRVLPNGVQSILDFVGI